VIDSIAEGLVLVCPPALACATVVVAGRARLSRRRESLNRALHELRRPLQALVLQAGTAAAGRDQLAQALTALADIDREVNGGSPPPARTLADARALAADAVRRWRGPAALEGRSLDLAWHANGSRLVCDEAAIARALDNLIANALEHGYGPIRVEGTERAGRLRYIVADGTAAGGSPWIARRRGPDARRGHGLRVVSEVAAAHGGRFAACAHSEGASAVLELPVAAVPGLRDAA
jgi:hypothetical protein